METVETMQTVSTIISTARTRAEQAEEMAAPAAGWPQLSAPELRRLRFLAYRRASGRLHPAAPLRAAGMQLAAEIAAYLRAPTPAPQLQDAAAAGVPPLWRAWLDAHRPAPCAPAAGCLER